MTTEELLELLLERLVRLETKVSRLMVAQGIPVQKPSEPVAYNS